MNTTLRKFCAESEHDCSLGFEISSIRGGIRRRAWKQRQPILDDRDLCVRGGIRGSKILEADLPSSVCGRKTRHQQDIGLSVRASCPYDWFREDPVKQCACTVIQCARMGTDGNNRRCRGWIVGALDHPGAGRTVIHRHRLRRAVRSTVSRGNKVRKVAKLTKSTKIRSKCTP